eukprot:1142916-Pelagomonas_calceolata.AAC.2
MPTSSTGRHALAKASCFAKQAHKNLERSGSSSTRNLVSLQLFQLAKAVGPLLALDAKLK